MVRPLAPRTTRRGALMSVFLLAVAMMLTAGCGGDEAATTVTTSSPAEGTATTTGGGGGDTTTTAPPVVKSGAELYSVFCAGCHGLDGKAKFSPTLVGVDAERVKKMVTDGSDKMEGYGAVLSAEEIQAVVDHVLTLK